GAFALHMRHDQDQTEQDEGERASPAADYVPEPFHVDVAIDQPERSEADEDDAPGQCGGALSGFSKLRRGCNAPLGEHAAVDRMRLENGVDDGEEPDECDQRAEEGSAAAMARHGAAEDKRPAERERALVETEVKVPETREHREESSESRRFPL